MTWQLNPHFFASQPNLFLYPQPHIPQPVSQPMWPATPTAVAPPTSIRLLTWNVNYSSPHASTRLRCILTHLETAVLQKRQKEPDPCCILLQEVSAAAFAVLRESRWIRHHFSIIPAGPESWPAGSQYGVVTLVARSVPVVSVQTYVFPNSLMGRHALVVDVALREPRSARPLSVRVANVHLESLPEHAGVRAAQLMDVARKLTGMGLYGGIVAGDMNALSSKDAAVYKQAGLLDAYKGSSHDQNGFTWGYQPRTPYPPSRLDRIYYTPGYGRLDAHKLMVSEPHRVGVGLNTADKHWASDHYGLVTKIRFSEY